LVLSARAQDAAAPGSAPVQSAPVPLPTPPVATPAAPSIAPAAPVAAQPAAPSAAAPAAPAAPPDASAAAPSASSNASAAPAAPPSGVPVIGGALLPQDLSPWGMFLNADLVVKAVIIGLGFASLVTWTVFVAKSFELRKARREVRAGLRILTEAVALNQAHEQLRNSTTAAAQLMQAAGQEIRLSAGVGGGDGLKERIAWQLERLEIATGRKISRGTGVLATIGATAPFVGLFGTVWGIMNSFIGISNAHTTNLAVVAPGIAQALLATALGLIAAIPAVMIYNVLARSTAHYRALLGDASAQVMRLVSRDLDRARLPLAQAAE
jgi:biopolymer transport protein ExbB